MAGGELVYRGTGRRNEVLVSGAAALVPTPTHQLLARFEGGHIDERKAGDQSEAHLGYDQAGVVMGD